MKMPLTLVKFKSDIDLLTIKDTTKSFYKRSAEIKFHLWHILGSKPISLFAVTSREIQERLSRGDKFFSIDS